MFFVQYRPRADKIREWFNELARMGYGSLEEKGRSLKFTAYPITDAPPAGERSVFPMLKLNINTPDNKRRVKISNDI